MPPKKHTKDQKRTSGTLAGASEHGLNRVLNRGGERERQQEQRKRSALLHRALNVGTGQTSESGLLKRPSQGPTIHCGAPAKQHIDESEITENKDSFADNQEGLEWEEDDLCGIPGPPGGTSTLEICFDEEERGRSHTRVTKKDREFQQLLHRVHLQCLLARGFLLDNASKDPVLQACMVSMVPDEGDFFTQKDPNATLPLVKRITAWFKANFQAVPGEVNGSSAVSIPSPSALVVDHLKSVIEKQKGGPEELCAVFASLLRAIGLLVRIVSVMNPCPLRPNASYGRRSSTTVKSIEHNPKGEKTSKKTAKQRTSEKQAGPSKKRDNPDEGKKDGSPSVKKRKGDEEFERQLAMAIEATAVAHGEATDPETVTTNGKETVKTSNKGSSWSRTPVNQCCHWCEVFCGTAAKGKWFHADPVLGWIDRCDAVENTAFRSLPLAYVVAFDGAPKDVTKRYANDFLQSGRHRDEEWWGTTLSMLRTGKNKSHGKVANGSIPEAFEADRSTLDDMRTIREDAELIERAVGQQQAAPRTVEDFKKHPVFVLKRHISKYQALALDTVTAGLHRGEPYYLREQLVDVHTKQRWWRVGRVVREDEIDTPYKRIEPKAGPSKEQNDEVIDLVNKKQRAMKLYGIWQTDKWQAPVAMNGIVPKNDYGNVEVPPLCGSVPIGTVHLNYPYLIPVCKKLGIDFARAVVGFERTSGAIRPKIEGIVVCEEHQGAIMDSYLEAEKQREEDAVKDRENLGRSGWISLLGAVWTRIRLDESYKGSVANPIDLDGSDNSAEGSGIGSGLEVEAEEF